MTKHDPAYPSPYKNNDGTTDYFLGMTKREVIAKDILCALISFSHDGNVPNENNIKGDVKFFVKITDWLLEELNKQKSI